MPTTPRARTFFIIKTVVLGSFLLVGVCYLLASLLVGWNVNGLAAVAGASVLQETGQEVPLTATEAAYATYMLDAKQAPTDKLVTSSFKYSADGAHYSATGAQVEEHTVTTYLTQANRNQYRVVGTKTLDDYQMTPTSSANMANKVVTWKQPSGAYRSVLYNYDRTRAERPLLAETLSERLDNKQTFSLSLSEYSFSNGQTGLLSFDNTDVQAAFIALETLAKNKEGDTRFYLDTFSKDGQQRSFRLVSDAGNVFTIANGVLEDTVASADTLARHGEGLSASDGTAVAAYLGETEKKNQTFRKMASSGITKVYSIWGESQELIETAWTSTSFYALVNGKVRFIGKENVIKSSKGAQTTTIARWYEKNVRLAYQITTQHTTSATAGANSTAITDGKKDGFVIEDAQMAKISIPMSTFTPPILLMLLDAATKKVKMQETPFYLETYAPGDKPSYTFYGKFTTARASCVNEKGVDKPATCKAL
ncbi:hypothetical protein COU19_03465 [Candidatus Kaiserbacteria bacterium CG10_big_fil_rev_8_21_14_0_10_56_12]|uniref:Uncharacterized protein n=1 Tax=Candidatus Kaiserbacteria bacterium CG10_big_fil_rev_8_21_14_0_10_56_12 TaxID=1974611 RepID=A0A2H0U917_9BACT|nr:MAG: hypothetical protein COU19_03465 [Candidatus Kaiserbacteria bacterium CG10_big_fil_rev_8_21_14_0_10_56_12]